MNQSEFADLVYPPLPLTAIVLGLLLALPTVVLLGYLSGAAQSRRADERQREILATSGETTLGGVLALMGLLIAFAFGNALNLAETRKAATLLEANALGTAFLRADYLPEPGKSELKQRLFDYARTRVATSHEGSTGTDATQFLAATLRAQADLWPATLEATAEPTPPALRTFVAAAINDVIDAHSHRLNALSAPASDRTGAMVIAATLLGLFLVGNRAALQGRPLTWRTFVFAAFLWVVLSTIADLQRAREGMLRADDTLLRVAVSEMAAKMIEN